MVVEGGPKGIKAYKKLMLRRIDWVMENEGGEEEERAPNVCRLVCEGNVTEKRFKGFRFKSLLTEQKVREFLEKMRCAHYWDTARNYIPEDGL